MRKNINIACIAMAGCVAGTLLPQASFLFYLALLVLLAIKLHR